MALANTPAGKIYERGQASANWLDVTLAGLARQVDVLDKMIDRMLPLHMTMPVFDYPDAARPSTATVGEVIDFLHRRRNMAQSQMEDMLDAINQTRLAEARHDLELALDAIQRLEAEVEWLRNARDGNETGVRTMGQARQTARVHSLPPRQSKATARTAVGAHEQRRRA